MRSVFDECTAVAEASDIQLPRHLWQAVLDIAESMAGQRSSTAQDLARGKPSEIDHLNGYIVRRGAELGIATPVNHALHCLVRLLEK
jgi:2-dehydropantoate 2-reductase